MDNTTDTIKIWALLFCYALMIGCSTKKLAQDNFGSFIDKRDGQNYNWVRLKDGKKWMTENLKYKVSIDSKYYNDNDNNSEFGRFYSWKEAIMACPEGWQLASNNDLKNLIDEYGGGTEAYKVLINKGESKFAAMLGGDRRTNGVYKGKGLYGSYWSSTSKSDHEAWAYDFFEPQKIFHQDFGNKNSGYSCRCVKN